MPEQESRRNHPELTWGIILIVAGGIWLLNNIGVVSLHRFWSHWPLLIVLYGVIRLFQSSNWDQRGHALWVVFIGAWLYVSIQRFWGLGFSESWPLLLVAGGISILCKTFVIQQRMQSEKE
jgi:hypothetical protein